MPTKIGSRQYHGGVEPIEQNDDDLIDHQTNPRLNEIKSSEKTTNQMDEYNN